MMRIVGGSFYVLLLGLILLEIHSPFFKIAFVQDRVILSILLGLVAIGGWLAFHMLPIPSTSAFVLSLFATVIGMLWYVSGPLNQRGQTILSQEVNLPTIVPPGISQVRPVSFPLDPHSPIPEDFDGKVIEIGPNPNLKRGGQTQTKVVFQNTGRAIWRRGNPTSNNLSQVYLGTDHPVGLVSPFGRNNTAGWGEYANIVYLVEEAVPPGKTGTFLITFFDNPAYSAGKHNAAFHLAQGDFSWFGEGVIFTVSVESPIDSAIARFAHPKVFGAKVALEDPAVLIWKGGLIFLVMGLTKELFERVKTRSRRWLPPFIAAMMLLFTLIMSLAARSPFVQFFFVIISLLVFIELLILAARASWIRDRA